MPTLKQLTCQIERPGSAGGGGAPLQEFATAYADGFVETYVAIPQVSMPFTIRLRSEGYIASGLAMFVYMDGIYQCNRNRQNLLIPEHATSATQYEVNFLVRQKEEKLSDGTWRGREWRFEKLNVVESDSREAGESTNRGFDQLGTIEVVVLRCKMAPYETVAPFSRRQNGIRVADIAREPDQDFVGGMMGGLFDGMFEEQRSNSTESSKHSSTTDTETWYSIQNDGSSDGYQRSRDINQGGQTWRRHRQRVREPGSEPVWDENGLEESPSHYSEDRNQDPKMSWDGKIETVSLRPHRPTTATSTTRLHENFEEAPPGFQYNDGPAQDFPPGETKSGAPASVVIHINPPLPQAPEPPSEKWKKSHGGKHGKGSRDIKDAPSNSYFPAQGHAVSSEQHHSQSATGQHYSHQGPSRVGTPRVPGGWPEPPYMPNAEESHSQRHSRQHASRPSVSQTHQEPWNNEGGTRKERKSGNRHSKQSGVTNSGRGKPQQSRSSVDEVWSEEYSDSRVGRSNSSEPDQSFDNGRGDRIVGHPGPYMAVSPPQSWPYIPPSWMPYFPQNLPFFPGAYHLPGTQAGRPNVYTLPTEAQQAPDRPKSPEDDNDSSSQNTNSPTPTLNWETAGWETSDAKNAVASNDNDNIDWRNETSQPQEEWNTNVSADVDAAWSAEAEPSNPEPSAESAPSSASTVKPSLQIPRVSPYTQPYWSQWYRVNDVEEEKPLYTVPENVVEEKGASHQVLAGRAAPYTHRTCTPVYIDSHDHPYAVFVFKYRSKEMIERLFGIEISDFPDDEKKRLLSLSKEEIIEELFKFKISQSHHRPVPYDGESFVDGARQSWQQSPDWHDQNIKPSQNNEGSSNDERKMQKDPSESIGWDDIVKHSSSGTGPNGNLQNKDGEASSSIPQEEDQDATNANHGESNGTWESSNYQANNFNSAMDDQQW